MSLVRIIAESKTKAERDIYKRFKDVAEEAGYFDCVNEPDIDDDLIMTVIFGNPPETAVESFVAGTKGISVLHYNSGADISADDEEEEERIAEINNVRLSLEKEGVDFYELGNEKELYDTFDQVLRDKGLETLAEKGIFPRFAKPYVLQKEDTNYTPEIPEEHEIKEEMRDGSEAAKDPRE